MRCVSRLRHWMFAAALCGFVSFTPLSRADITGTVKLDGKAPEPKVIDMSGVKECNDQHPDPVVTQDYVVGDAGELANVVVSIKADDPSSLGGTVPKTPAVLDQKGCMYVPHVLAVMVGQEMQVKNDDPFLHNIHSFANQNPNFNKQQPNKDPGMKVDSPKTVEYYHVKCDVHPWMSAYVAVLDNPFFAVSDEKGQFTIKGTVPDGDYTITAWHEKSGTQEGKVTVKDGKGTVDFTFKPEAAMAAPAGAKKDAVAVSQTCPLCDMNGAKVAVAQAKN